MRQAKYMLDTNICIYMLKNHPQEVMDRFSRCLEGEVTISSIVWAELCCGIGTLQSKLEMESIFLRLQPRPFDSAAAVQFGILAQNHPERKNSFDRLIAAHAISLNLVLVTNNPADFKLYEASGLKLENWVA